MRKIKTYFKGVALEAKRIRWPKQKQLILAVTTVIIIAVIAGLIIYFEDWIVANMLQGFKDINSTSSTSSATSEASSNIVSQ